MARTARAHQAGCGFECSESIHKVNVELVEKPVNGITHITLSICLCPSHRHFPKKLVFFPLQDQIACMRRTR